MPAKACPCAEASIESMLVTVEVDTANSSANPHVVSLSFHN